MLIALVVSLAVAVAGWSMWILARRDASEAREEARDAHARARLSESRASAISAGGAAARDAQHAAEAQVRVAHVETSSLRRSLAMAAADREALELRLREVGADKSDPYDSSVKRLQLYGTPSGMRHRKDG